MTFNGIMNSPLLYGLVGLGIAYIILFCLITLKKAYKDVYKRQEHYEVIVKQNTLAALAKI